MGRRNPFKRVLTMFQIAQFYTCVAQAILVFLRVGGVGVMEVPRPLALLQLAYHITMILLFSDFYTHAFTVKVSTLRFITLHPPVTHQPHNHCVHLSFIVVQP